MDKESMPTSDNDSQFFIWSSNNLPFIRMGEAAAVSINEKLYSSSSPIVVVAKHLKLTAMAVMPHVVVLPYPCSGNINPAMQLARLLHALGVFVTFVNTEHNQRRLLATTEGVEAVRSVSGDSFQFETIPDGLTEDERGSQDYGLSLAIATSQLCAAPMRELLLRLKDSGVPPVTCVVPTFLMSFALDVAHELGIPTMVLWGCSAGALMGHMWLRQLREAGFFPIREAAELETLIDWIPGMPPIKLGDISGFLRRTDEPDNFGLRFNETETNSCTKADALILNTFDDLEVDVLAALSADNPRIYTIGPMGSLLRHCLNNVEEDDDCTSSSCSLSLWTQDTKCLEWLDKQEPGSVVYCSFGSHAVLTPEQMVEFAWGLAGTGRPFLWAVRENQVSGGADGLQLQEPLTDAASRGYLTTWCPQEQVLRHRAVGCFLTHSGWNSMCESIASGVPMVCWPGFADQYTNCKYACEEWAVGVQLDDVVTRDQVAGHVQLVMGTEEMRRRAAAWKEKAEKAVRPGGSSYQNLQSMLVSLVTSSKAEL